MNHAIAGNHNENGFYRYMRTKYPDDRNWKDSTSSNNEMQIRDYLDELELLVDDPCLSNLRGNILDLS